MAESRAGHRPEAGTGWSREDLLSTPQDASHVCGLLSVGGEWDWGHSMVTGSAIHLVTCCVMPGR